MSVTANTSTQVGSPVTCNSCEKDKENWWPLTNRSWGGAIHCRTCHSDRHRACRTCGTCLGDSARWDRFYCSTSCRVRAHHEREDAKLERAAWEAEHPEEAAKERAEYEAWAERTRSMARTIARSQGRNPEHDKKARELKLHAERCATCERSFGSGDTIYRRREFGGVEGPLLPYCEDHRCRQPEGRHNKDAPEGRYYPACQCDNGWDKPEPCESCGRLVSYDVDTHPARFTKDRTTAAQAEQRRRWAAEIRRLPVDEQREAWRELPREGRIVRTFCSDGCKRAEANARIRANRPERAPSKCISCDRGFMPSRADSLYCSSACRQRAYRDRKRLSGHLSDQEEAVAS